MPRTVTEEEFTAIRERVLRSLPPNLTEAEFQRVVGPAMEQALGIAENSPAPLQGSALDRALSSFRAQLPSVLGVLRGTATLAGAAVSPPLMWELMRGQFGQTADLTRRAIEAPTLSEKVGYGAAALVPGGAMVADAGEQVGQQAGRGDYAGAAGTFLGAVAPAVVPSLLPRTARVRGPLRVTPNPVEREAIAFAQQRGIPVDAGTLTGSPMIRNVQKRMEGTIGGAATVAKFQTKKDAALARVGRELADDVQPTPATPESAGRLMRASTEDSIRALDDVAEQSYGRLRSMENDPAFTRPVPAPPTAESKALQGAINVRARSTAGRVPTPQEWAELQRIREELDSIRYSDGKLVSENRGLTSDTYYVPRQANAPVYHDILQNAPGTSKLTGQAMIVSLDQALKSGTFTNAAKGALEVARKRIKGDRNVGSALFAKPGTLPPGPTQPMGLPVDVRAAKAGLRPLYDRLKREAELVPVQGDKARALTALDRLIEGPDFAPVSVVDGALSDLKAMARGAAMPELRTKGQGLAAEAVKQLEQQLQDAVHTAGPEAVDALSRGRNAVRLKAGVADTLDAIRAEPVRGFQQATAPRDTGIDFLRQVEQSAPDSVPAIARAWLDDVLDKATAGGKFEHADRLYADWQKLGPRTKAMLYGERVKDLDAFFLIAKRLNDNPNPSGTANVLAVNATQLLSYLPAKGLTKILYSPRGARLLTRGLRLSIRPGARAASVAAIQEAARAAQVRLPIAADNREAPVEQLRAR